MELELYGAEEGVIVEPAPPRTHVQLLDAAGVPVCSFDFAPHGHWSLNLFNILQDLDGTVVWFIDVQEAP
jgi:hypothetical protein